MPGTNSQDLPRAGVSPATMRLVLVDDEPLALKRLRGLLKDLGCRFIEAEFRTAAQALAYLRKHSADALFLDLHMPGLSGLDIIKELNELPDAPAIVVTTAWLEHALEAYGPLTVAYLLKPIDSPALSAALEKVSSHLRRRQEAEAPGDTAGQAQTVLVASEGKRSYRLLAGEVSFLRAENKYVCAYTKNASRFWLNESLSQLMNRLEPLFVRIHRNAAVNRREVDRLHRQVRVGASDSFGLRVGVRGWPEELEVSRTHRHRVRSLFKSVEVTRPR